MWLSRLPGILTTFGGGIFLFFLAANLSFAQSTKEKNWRIYGYVKDLHTFAPSIQNSPFQIDNLLHNRLNFRWYPHNNITIGVEVRNRLFYSQIVGNTPGFGEQIKYDDFFPLSFHTGKKNIVYQFMLDRASIQWNKGNWEIKAGRQRINWGMNLAWNPNDIFNAYSFFDFDYEERAGSDAVKVVYNYNGFSSIEVAGKITDKKENIVAAALWKTNKWNYDFQVLAGVAESDLVLGGGWAGNLKLAGFKGEISWFQPMENSFSDWGALSASASFDYTLKNSMYLNFGFLYNSSGKTKPLYANLLSFDISAKNLSPYTYTFFSQISYPFTPILNGSMALMYSPGNNTLFINPAISHSIVQNLDMDIIGQVYSSHFLEKYRLLGAAIFTRLKFSF